MPSSDSIGRICELSSTDLLADLPALKLGLFYKRGPAATTACFAIDKFTFFKVSQNFNVITQTAEI